MIEVRDLWKRYPGIWGLQDVSLQFGLGRVVGVLGENGSGKSSMFRILAGVSRPTRGEATVDGERVGVKTKGVTSYLPEVDPFYTWMTIERQLTFLSSFYDGWDDAKAGDLLDLMKLDRAQKVGDLSRGQRGRLKVVAAFARPSRLVIMDEPLSGIDPPSRKRILEGVFGEFRFEEQTILISTHIVSEVEAYIDDVVFLRKGEAVLQGNADELREEKQGSLSDIFEEVVQ